VKECHQRRAKPGVEIAIPGLGQIEVSEAIIIFLIVVTLPAAAERFSDS